MRVPAILLFGLLAAAPLPAQEPGAFGASCSSAGPAARPLCFDVAEAARILAGRTPLPLAGGNPVPGTASTLGMRLGSQPRISIGGRVTAAPVELPGLGSSPGGELDFTAVAVALDAAVGLFGGVTLGPTVGGFGSIDVLGSVGHLRVPEADGLFGNLTAWAGGLRVGLLRESFTAPGLSVSAMYRKLGDVGYGEPALGEGAAWFRVDELEGWSVRAAASKRVLGLGLTAGAGRDYFSATANGRVRDTSAAGNTLVLPEAELETRRNTLFASAAYTLVILQAVAELGWQGGGSGPAGIPDSGRLEQSGFYGSLALRLTL